MELRGCGITQQVPQITHDQEHLEESVCEGGRVRKADLGYDAGHLQTVAGRSPVHNMLLSVTNAGDVGNSNYCIGGACLAMRTEAFCVEVFCSGICVLMVPGCSLW